MSEYFKCLMCVKTFTLIFHENTLIIVMCYHELSPLHCNSHVSVALTDTWTRLPKLIKLVNCSVGSCKSININKQEKTKTTLDFGSFWFYISTVKL